MFVALTLSIFNLNIQLNVHSFRECSDAAVASFNAVHIRGISNEHNVEMAINVFRFLMQLNEIYLKTHQLRTHHLFVASKIIHLKSSNNDDDKSNNKQVNRLHGTGRGAKRQKSICVVYNIELTLEVLCFIAHYVCILHTFGDSWCVLVRVMKWATIYF